MVGMVLAVPVYNYQFARDNGFVAWFFLGEFVPTLKGAAWPYFVYADHSASQDNDLKLAYWTAVNAIAKDHEVESDDSLSGRVQEREHLMGKHAAEQLLAEGISKKTDFLEKDISALEQITPPPFYRKLHADQIAMVKNVARLQDLAVKALKRDDAEEAGRLLEQKDKYNQEMLPLLKQMSTEMKSVGVGQ